MESGVESDPKASGVIRVIVQSEPKALKKILYIATMSCWGQGPWTQVGKDR